MTKRAVVSLTALFVALPLVIWAAEAFDRPEPPPGSLSGPAPGPPTATSHSARLALTQAQEDELMASLGDKQPETHKRLMDLKKSSPERFRWALRSMWPWYQRFKNLPKDVQKAMLDEQEAKVEIWRIVDALGKSKDAAERTKLLTDLQDAVSKQFNADQVLREHKLTELEQQITRLREELQQRKGQREQILKERVEEWVKASTQPAQPPREHRMGPPPTRPAGPRPPENE